MGLRPKPQNLRRETLLDFLKRLKFIIRRKIYEKAITFGTIGMCYGVFGCFACFAVECTAASYLHH
jgi:hypothetical protein